MYVYKNTWKFKNFFVSMNVMRLDIYIYTYNTYTYV